MGELLKSNGDFSNRFESSIAEAPVLKEVFQYA